MNSQHFRSALILDRWTEANSKCGALATLGLLKNKNYGGLHYDMSSEISIILSDIGLYDLKPEIITVRIMDDYSLLLRKASSIGAASTKEMRHTLLMKTEIISMLDFTN